MTNPRPTPRPVLSSEPPTPKPRPKAKPRVRNSPSQKKASPSLSVAAASSAAAHAAAVAAAAAVASPTPAQQYPQQQVYSVPRPVALPSSAPKRSRSSASLSREPDAKRPKPISGAAAASAAARHAAASAAAAAAAAHPASPTTSSRSRPRKRAASRAAHDADAASAAHVSAAGTSAPPPRARPPQKGRTSTARPLQPLHVASCFTVEGSGLPSNVKATCVEKRLFGHEIQCLMHAFGEVRYCARDVLELVEDAVRDVVGRVAITAQQAAVEEVVAKHRAEGVTLPPKLEGVVRMRHVAYCLRRDPRAMQRLNQSLKRSGDAHPDKLPQEPAERVFNHAPKPWELISELGNLTGTTNAAATERMNGTDLTGLCSWQALHTFKKIMGLAQFQDFCMCRGVTFVRQESKSRAPSIRDQPRLALFREWLNVDNKFQFQVPDEALFALGHVAWEAVGLLTQTALLHRYFDDIAKGYGDPRSSKWSYSRHIVSAINYGLGTEIMVPLTESQATSLRHDIDTYMTVMQTGASRWRGYSTASTPCLLPYHIREALRRLERAPDSIWGFRDRSFLLSSSFL